MATASGARLRILILTHPFPPMNAIGAHRPYAWARAWRDLGHEVEVVTPQKYAFDGALDLQRDLSGIAVHEVPYVSRDAGSTPPGGVPSSVHRWEWLKTFTRRLRLRLGPFAEPRWLAYRPMLSRALSVARARPFDLIIATSPPEVSLFVARGLSHRTGTPWVADFRDLWFHDMLLYRWRITARLAGVLNRAAVRGASVLIAVSRGLHARLADYMGREVVISYNGFVAEVQPPAAWSDGKRRVVYTGRMYPGKRDPEPLFRALARLRGSMPDIAQRLSVEFYGFDDPWLRAIIRRHAVEDCVQLHGFVPYRQSMAIQRGADALLFLDWMDVGAEGVLTGKLFEYLGSRRPILALGPRKSSEAAQIIADTGAGTTLTTDDEIVAYLRELIASPRRPDIAPERVAAYSRERQALELLDAIVARLPRLQPRR